MLSNLKAKFTHFISRLTSFQVQSCNKMLASKISTHNISHMGNINSTLQYNKLGWTGLQQHIYSKVKPIWFVCGKRLRDLLTELRL